jgi:hypothetical protein
MCMVSQKCKRLCIPSRDATNVDRGSGVASRCQVTSADVTAWSGQDKKHKAKYHFKAGVRLDTLSFWLWSVAVSQCDVLSAL